MKEIAENLKQIRLKAGLSQAEFAKKIGVSQRTWSSYEMGETRPKVAIIMALSSMGYKIDGITEGTATCAIEEASEKTGLTKEEILRQRFEQVKNISPNTPTEELPPPKFTNTREIPSLKKNLETSSFLIPVLDQSLSAGKGQPLPEDDTPTGYIAVPKEMKRYGNKLAALYVNGDSMEPTLHRGDLVICDSCGWDGDGIYALRMDGCGYVKRLSKKPGKLVVISDNPKYEPWEEPAESEAISIIGRVHYALNHVD